MMRLEGKDYDFEVTCKKGPYYSKEEICDHVVYILINQFYAKNIEINFDQ